MVSLETVLSVDDHGDTLAEVIGALKRHGIKVDEARNVEEAGALLSSQQFDFILADARLPVGRELEMSAGPRMLESLQRGVFGDLNRETPCLILTSYPYEVNQERYKLENYRGLLSKLSMTPEIIGDMMGLDLSDPEASGPGEEIQRQLLRIEKVYDPEDRFVGLSAIDSEGRDVVVPHPVDDLPPDIRFRYRHAKRPVLLWASLDVAAATPAEMRPRSFEPYLGSSVEELEKAWNRANS